MSNVKRAYRYRFYPTDEQKRILARTFGCVRYTYNWALQLSIDTYQQTGKGLSYKQLSTRLTTLKQQAETLFLNEVSCVPCQQALRHLKRAYVNFFEPRETAAARRQDPCQNSRSTSGLSAQAFDETRS